MEATQKGPKSDPGVTPHEDKLVDEHITTSKSPNSDFVPDSEDRLEDASSLSNIYEQVENYNIIFHI